jgi:hypothetical protein
MIRAIIFVKRSLAKTDMHVGTINITLRENHEVRLPLHLTCVRNQTSQPAMAAMIKKHAGMIMIEFATMGALLSSQGGSAIGLSATDALG